MEFWVIYLVVLLCALTNASFSGKECLNSHNVLRGRHKATPLRYSKELEKSAQAYADKLALTDDDKNDPRPTRNLPKKRRDIPATTPFFHKEMWDGEIVFPYSRWDLNKGRKVAIGESIHKFCCYSFPYCPSDFFHGLNFPPSAKGVIGHWYKEVSNYDFEKGKRKDEKEEVRHFTNIVWKKTTEVGCAQSKRSKKGCIYTIARYRVEGSVGWEEDYKKNVASTTPISKKKVSSGKSYLTAFLVVLFIVFILVGVIVIYIKRVKIKALYAEYKIKRGAKKAEARLKDDYDEGSFRGKRNIIYKGSSKKARPDITLIPNTSPHSTLPMKPRNPTQIEQRTSVVFRPETDSCHVTIQPPTTKPLPPRPTSPVHADSPVLRHQTEAAPTEKKPVPTRQIQRASLPPPPPPPSKPATENVSTSGPSSSSASKQVGRPSSEMPVAAGKPVPEPRKPLESRKPLPTPASTAAPLPSSNGVPKPAPRPNRPQQADQQFQARPLPSGRPVQRASRKNPNFRTLPLNDRGSLKREVKSKEDSTDGRKQLKPTNADDNSKLAKPVQNRPLLPKKTNVRTAVKDVESQQKKPLLPKNLQNVIDDTDRPKSVSEMRKLLEKNNQR